jgi:mycothiol synthase
MGFHYRHPTEGDIGMITDVLNRSQEELPLHLDETLEEVAMQTFGNPDYDPQRHWIVTVSGEAVGYGGVLTKKSRIEAGMNDGWVNVEVIPEQRGRGIEQQLIRYSLECLRSGGADTAKCWCMGTRGWKHDIVTEFGFEDSRHEFLMVWKGCTVPDCPLPEGIHFEHRLFKEAADEEIRVFVNVFNNAFSEHYDFTPAPVQRFLRTRDSERNISRITFAKEGNTICGIGKCCESVPYNEEHNTTIGWIDILGVIKAYRKRGIGRALLSDCLEWIHQRGMDTVYLEMDSENRDALHLYTSAGFAVDRENMIYQLELK